MSESAKSSSFAISINDKEYSDFFGRSVASRDFNKDGIDDLGIGIAGEIIETINNAGAVNVIYGSDSGLETKQSSIGSKFISIRFILLSISKVV